MSDIKKFSDFADPSITSMLDGKKAFLETDVLGKEINVLNYKITRTKYADSKNDNCLMVQFAFADKPEEHRVFFTGSGVLLSQLEKYKENLPFSTTIKRERKYFTFS